MKIGYDIRSFLKEESGIGIYIKNLLKYFLKKDMENEYYLLSSSLKDRFDKTMLPPSENLKIKDFRIPVKMLNYLWYKLKFPPLDFFFLKRLDLIHSPVPSIIPGGRKKIITIHDTCFIDKPLLVMQEAIDYFKKDFIKSVKKADGIIAISEWTKSRILDIAGKEYEDKIEVIYHGSDFDNLKSQKPGFSLPERYLLFVGTIEPRKNILRMIKAMKIIINEDKDLKLLLVGKKGWAYKEILEYMAKSGMDESIIITEYVSREELKYIYEKSLFLIFPSLYEGFGLPILESAYTETPVIASDIRVFREIFRDFPVYFDPLSPEDMAEAIKNLLSDKKLYQQKKQLAVQLKERLKLEYMTENTLNFYKRIAK